MARVETFEHPSAPRLIIYYIDDFASGVIIEELGGQASKTKDIHLSAEVFEALAARWMRIRLKALLSERLDAVSNDELLLNLLSGS